METRFGSLGIFLVTFFIGGGLVDTAVHNSTSYFSFEFIACALLGLLLVLGSFLIFYALVLPAWTDKHYTLKNELTGLVKEDQTGKQDSDATERLITDFRNSLREFFDRPGLPENSPLQNTATQLYWHILYLQKRRMEQLGVTMDYSIFLWHSFKENEKNYEDHKEAMAVAINETLKSVVGSSVTTIAGFAALCFMRFRFGLDVGLVMMKGVALGVICCVTILPSLILQFEKAIEKTRHRPLLPTFSKIADFVQKHNKAVFLVFLLAWIPAIYGYTHYDVYYDIIQTLPKNLPSMVASQEMEDTFSMNNTLMILADADLDAKSGDKMSREIKELDGVSSVISVDSFLGEGIPREMIPETLKEELYGGGYQLMLVASEYVTATDEMNQQIDSINEIIHNYDSRAMLIGDAPCTKDLITISDHDFNVVSWTSIGIIAAIILFVFTSLSLPVLLVLVIECAIFINMGLAYYTGTTLPFIASIVIGTIQLGSTVDYAILMTSRYQVERRSGKDKREAVLIAHKSSIQSIFVSAMSFFAATFGVGVYSGIAVISSLCMLMARGALISMVTVVFALPAVLLLFDPVIIRTSRGFVSKENKLGNTGSELSHSM